MPAPPATCPAPSPSAGTRQPSLGHLPGLDGLRAIAVLAVLGYHAGLDWLPGGFLGVDVFFVISGFLITSLLLAEREAGGRINLRAFWLRRARRLLPALFLVLLSTMVFAVLFVPDEVARLRGDTVAALGYVTNWWLILRQQSYFEAIGRPSPLLHLWSLAVEEQFYVVWPIALSVGLRVLRRRGMLVAVLAGAAGSALLMAALYDPNADPSRVYYGTDTHAVGLLVGAALAFAWTWWTARERARATASAELDALATAHEVARREEADGPLGGVGRVRQIRRVAWALRWDAVAIAALAVVGAFFVQLDEAEPFLYQGGFAVLALATAAVIAAVVHPSGHVGSRLLDARPLRWIGERSYGIYLWHWPVFTFTRPGVDVPLDPVSDLALRVAITLVCAELSYRFLETPVRRGALGRAWQRWREPRERGRLAYGTQLAGGAAALGLGLLLAARVAGATPPPTPSYLAVTAIHEAAASAGSVAPAPSPAASEASTDSSGARPGASPAVTPPSSAGGPAGPGRASPSPSGPATTPSPRPIRGRIFAVGDSVMLGAVPQLHTAIPNLQVDAEVGRSFFVGMTILQQRAQAGTLPGTVIVALGDNGWITVRQLDQLMHVIGPQRRVVYVNLKLPHSWEAHDNQVIADAASRYPNMTVADWHDASVNHPEYFWDDATHLRPQGAVAYARMLASVVRQAAQQAAQPAQ